MILPEYALTHAHERLSSKGKPFNPRFQGQRGNDDKKSIFHAHCLPNESPDQMQKLLLQKIRPYTDRTQLTKVNPLFFYPPLFCPPDYNSQLALNIVLILPCRVKLQYCKVVQLFPVTIDRLELAISQWILEKISHVGSIIMSVEVS